MEVLNASIVKPIPKKLSPFKSPKPHFSPNAKFPSLEQFLPRGIALGLSTITTTLFSNNLAKSLTYEEALGLGQSQAISQDDSLIDNIIKFITENPLIIGGGALALFVPVVLSQLLQKPKAFGVISAKNAYTKILEEPETQLLDIREGKDLKLVGTPDIKSSKKKVVSITYRGDDKQGFLKKIDSRLKDPANITLLVLDKFDGNSELVAELATVNGFKAAYAIKDGAEGTRGWLNSGLPWTEPKKTLGLDFSQITDAISGVLGESSDGLPVTLALAAATGFGVLVFTEIETVLQLLGSAAIVQVVTKKLLFAEDRKQTVEQLGEFLNTKVAPKELAEEIKMIGKALLPVSSSSTKSLPAAVTSTPVATSPEPPVEGPKVVVAAPEPPVEEPKVVVETTTEVKEEFETPVQEKSTPVVTKSLSPYPYYPDFKPPSSPSPSQP